MAPIRVLVLACLTALLVGAGLFVSPGLLGSPGGEVYGHAWVQWWHGQALPAWPAGTPLAEGTENWPVIDPIPTAIGALIGRLFSPIVGYNTWILLSVFLAAIGGAIVARWEDGDWVTGSVVLGLSPALLGSLMSGLTEDGAVGLAAIGLAGIGRRSPLLVGLTLGLLSWCGLVLSWYAAVVSVGFGLWSIATTRQWRPIVVAGLVAVLMALPVALLQGDRLLGAGHQGGQFLAQTEPLWRLNPWRGVDVLSFLTPGFQDPGDAMVRMHPGYLGLVPILLAIRGGRSRWWWVLLGSMLIAVGPSLSWGGTPTGISNPFALLAHHLPLGSLLNHHGRALLVGWIALAVLAARGTMCLSPAWRHAARLLLLADLVLLSPVGVSMPIADTTPPDVLSSVSTLSEGSVLVVPAAGPGVHFQRPLFDQRVHGRPLLLSPNHPGLPVRVRQTSAGQWLAGLGFVENTKPDELVFSDEISVLVALPEVADAVEAVLGPPDKSGADRSAAWDIPLHR